MTDFENHLTRQIAFSRATFGPSERRKGVIDHIRKELVEIEEGDGDPKEWVDVVLLALDGLWRSMSAKYPRWRGPRLARVAVKLILEKQGKNEFRDWPDWRTASEDKAIEHERAPTPGAWEEEGPYDKLRSGAAPDEEPFVIALDGPVQMTAEGLFDKMKAGHTMKAADPSGPVIYSEGSRLIAHHENGNTTDLGRLMVGVRSILNRHGHAWQLVTRPKYEPEVTWDHIEDEWFVYGSPGKQHRHGPYKTSDEAYSVKRGILDEKK